MNITRTNQKTLDLEVLQSNAGFYIGTFSHDEDSYGPVSRESIYYATKNEAELALKTNTFKTR